MNNGVEQFFRPISTAYISDHDSQNADHRAFEFIFKASMTISESNHEKKKPNLLNYYSEIYALELEWRVEMTFCDQKTIKSANSAIQQTMAVV